MLSFYTSVKTPENQRFAGVFSGYIIWNIVQKWVKEIFAWNVQLLSIYISIPWKIFIGEDFQAFILMKWDGKLFYHHEKFSKFLSNATIIRGLLI